VVDDIQQFILYIPTFLAEEKIQANEYFAVLVGQGA
jgi:hypothetical protein